MALANVAWILASNGLRVLAVDWDLESPGLHRYFTPFLKTEPRSRSGVVDIVTRYQWEAVAEQERPGDWHREFARVGDHASPLAWDFPDGGALDFLSAGQQNVDYAA